MTRLRTAALVLVAGGCAGSAALAAQEWTTSGVDAQRTSWVRADERLTTASVSDGTFAFLWKAQFDNKTRGMHSLTPPVLLDRLIGYRGFKALAFLGGSSDRVFAIDTDLNKPYWMVQLNYAAATGGRPPITPECPGALTATPARRTSVVQPAFARGDGGGARAGARSAVGEPGRGAAVMSQAPRGRGPGGPPPPAATARGGRARGAVPAIPFGGVDPLYVVGTDGFLRVLRTSDGTEAEPGAPFVPPGATPSALIFIDGAVYTTTSNGCGVAPNGVWMIDLTSPDRAVTSWPTGGPNIVGTSGLAFGTDGMVFVAVGPVPTTGGGQPATTAQFANSIVALDASTLTVKDWFSASGAGFNTSPMVVRHDNRDLVIVTADDGKMYVLDGASLGGADHRTPLHVTAAYSDAGAGGSLATWESQGTRWILAPAVGAPKPGLAFAANGPSAGGRIVTFKLTGTDGKFALEPGWASRSLPSPLGPIVVNGVVFTAASGNRSTRAVLYALDGGTGRELWSSRTTITSFAQGGLAAGAGQVYLVTYDNSLYAFGVPMEH